MSLLNEAELVLIEMAMKSGDEYSDEDRAFNRLLSDVRGLREAIASREHAYSTNNQCHWTKGPRLAKHCTTRNCIYLEVTEGGKE